MNGRPRTKAAKKRRVKMKKDRREKKTLSRVMPMVVDEDHVQRAREVRELLAAYDDIEDLVSIGAYKTGAKPIADRALALHDKLNIFLRQNKNEGTPYETTQQALEVILR